MDKFTPLAWAAILLIVIVALAVNAWMLFMLRNRDKSATNHPLQMKRERPSGAVNLQQMFDTVRSPFKKEQDQLGELSRKVDELKSGNKDQQE